MVKGVNRQVIVVKAPEQAMFDQAIFILREDALEKDGIGERELLEEAQKIANSYIHQKPREKKHQIAPPVWILLGAIPVAFFWLLTVLL